MNPRRLSAAEKERRADMLSAFRGFHFFLTLAEIQIEDALK